MGLEDRIREIARLVGNTPVVKLKRLPPEGVEVYVKLEYMNPTGSHKDRIAVYMLMDAVRRGLLKEGGTVVEASSGNTAISVAWVASQLGVRAVIVVDEEASAEKVAVLRALGAEVVRVPASRVIEVAEKIARETGGVFLNQYASPANHQAHYETTGPEILRQVGGSLDAFVMGMGTCGTVTGVGRYLKEKLGDRVRVVGVVPRGSAIAGGKGGDYIDGLIAYFKPKLCSMFCDKYVDEIIEVDRATALEYMVKLAKLEGILAGPSTGANVYAALQVAKELRPGSRIVTIAADSIFRYAGLVSQLVERVG